MKKNMKVLPALFILFSVLCISGLSSADEGYIEQYLERLNAQDHLMRYVMHISVDGKPIASEAVTAKLNGQNVTCMEIEGQKVRILRNRKGAYIVSDNERNAINLSVIGINPDQFSTPVYAGAKVTSSGTDAVMGKKLPYKAIAIPGGSIRYYIDGKRLAYITGRNGAQDFIMEVLEVTTQVPSSLFQIPKDYTIVNSIEDMKR